MQLSKSMRTLSVIFSSVPLVLKKTLKNNYEKSLFFPKLSFSELTEKPDKPAISKSTTEYDILKEKMKEV